MGLDYIELMTITITIIGGCFMILKWLSKLIHATENQTAEFKVFRTSCTEKFDDVYEILEEHDGYIKDNTNRINKMEDR